MAVFGTAQSIDPNAGLLVVAVLAVVAAGVVLVGVWVVTKPPRPAVGAVAMDGAGLETPALVDLLTGGFGVEDDAVPATVIDLAARGWFDIEEVGGGNVVIRSRAGVGELTRYEERVRRHVERRAIDGIAPAAALTLGPAGASKRWWKGFVREVNRHGRDLGLCRRRWDVRHLVMVWTPAAAAWLAVAATGSTADRVDTSGAWGEPAAFVFMLCVMAVVGLSVTARRITRSDAQAPTPAGMEAASRWLGVREYLAGTGSFDEAPAPSVVIWERQLAYATAMGLAPVVQRQLPFETEHDRHAWSRASGHWRRVRVRYLSLRPGWGTAPWSAALAGAVQSGFLGIVVWVGLRFAREEFDLSSSPQSWQDWLPLIGSVAAAVAAAGFVWTAAKALCGVLDLVPRRTVEGELVRRREYRSGHRLPKVLQWMLWSGRDQSGQRRNAGRRVRYHLAIDDGSDDRIVAFEVRPAIFGRARQGAKVRALVTPLLGYVTELTETSPPPAPEAQVAHELVEEAATKAAAAAASMIDRLGRRLALLETRTDDDRAPLLDRVDDDGMTARQRLSAAQQELNRLSVRTNAAGPRSADGTSLLGGLSESIATALGGVSGTSTGADPALVEDGPGDHVEGSDDGH